MAYSKENYKKKKIDTIVEDLNKKLDDFKNNDETYKQFLDTTAKFHNYSINNIMLIAGQNPEATAVAGYKAWKNKFDRQVQKGAKSMNIIAPIVQKKNVDVQDKNGNVVRDNNGQPKTERKPLITGYRAHSVFDVADTKGKPLITAQDLIKTEFENSNDYKDLYNEFKDYINDELTPSVEEKHFLDDQTLSGGAKGYYSPKSDEIVISDDLSYDMRFKTLIHEYAHSQLHNDDIGKTQISEHSRSLKEIEAESSAYVVSNYYGLDTSDYSLGYLTGWGQNISDDELKDHIKNIHSFAKTTIEEINSLPQFSQYIDKKLESEMNKDLQEDLSTMIDTNLKNGFDKVTVIKGNLVNDFGFKETSENQYENEDFKINIDYKGFNTNNPEDKCKIHLNNKNEESMNKDYNFTQTYNRNVINNTATIFIQDDDNEDKSKKYIHERDIDGNIFDEKHELSPENEIVSFENFINDSVDNNGLNDTLRQFVSNGVLMGYELNTDHIENTNETYLSMNKKEQNGRNSLMSAKVEHDNDDNVYIDFKIKNSAGIKNLSFNESNEEFDKNEQNKKVEIKKEEEIDI
ncbi:ArdC-like ssDNA-binding domain-containing protein [Staphylococcus equorum]|uniref:ArdC-like ssDNA-binding domain-containing protein n=1 Tax=Staphylococcus equorum TaxID=246432 RepID=UPI003F5799C1